MRVNVQVVDKGAEGMVARFDGHEQLRIALRQPFGVITKQRAVGVDLMHQGPRQREKWTA